MTPSVTTIKRLFAVSGNRCAFPACAVPIVDRVSGRIAGEVAHIKAKSPSGPRFDRDQTDEQRHSFENLMLICPLHHQIIDTDLVSYTVERLSRMKSEHESQSENVGDVADDLVQQLINISDVRVSGGSIIVSSAQSGGQVAQTIVNVDSQPTRAPLNSAGNNLEGLALRELWDAFQDAFSWVFQVASPLQEFEDPSRMNSAQFEEFLQRVDLPESAKQQLRHSSDRWRDYAKIEHRRKLGVAVRKRVAFHNLLVKHRIVLEDAIKQLLNDVDNEMTEALNKMELVLDGESRNNWRDAFHQVHAIEEKIPALENLIASRLRGR